MLFRKKKEERTLNLVEILKQRPDEAFVCPEYVAVWSPALEKAIFIFGSYTHLSDEEINILLQEKSKLVLQ